MGLVPHAAGHSRARWCRPCGGVVADRRRIAKMQNTDRFMALRRAITVAHQRSQWAQGVSFAVSIVIAVLGLLSKLQPHLTGTAVLLVVRDAGSVTWRCCRGVS